MNSAAPQTAPATPLAFRGNAAFVLFMAALVPGIIQLFHPTGFGFGQGFEMPSIARNLAEHGVYGNPFPPVETGPTAVVPPLYPLILAALIRIFREPALIVFAAVFGTILVNALSAAMLPRVSAAALGDDRPGIVAGLLWVGCMRLMPQWDFSCTMAAMLLFCLFTARSLSRDPAIAWGGAAGILAGLLTLLNPATLIMSVPWTVFLLFSRRIRPARACWYAGALLAGVAVTNGVWVARNYRIWHAPVLRTNFGISVYTSNNPCAQPSLLRHQRAGCDEATNPSGNESEARLMRTLGEVEYDRRRTADAMAWIHANPDRFRQLTRARIFEFWFPVPLEPVYPAYVIWGVTILSIPGLIALAARRNPFAWYISFVWLVYPLMYYIVVSSDRYRYPLLWTSLLAAGYFVARIPPLHRLLR